MAHKARKAEAFLPLTAAVFHILLALSDEKRHGLGIMSEVEERTLGAVRLGPGTLYGTIKRMLASGLIEEDQEAESVVHAGKQRRCYRITAVGLSVARAETNRSTSGRP